MHNHLPHFGLACAGVLGVVPDALAAITFVPVSVPNWLNVAGATGASADGSVLAGSKRGFGPERPTAFRWTAEFGYVDIGAGFAPGMNAAAVSADGTTIVGTVNSDIGYSYARPYYWNLGAGGTLPGLLPGGTYGWAQGVSGDGSIMIGYGDSDTGSRAWKWSPASGYTVLPTPAPYTYAITVRQGISTTGDVIAGYVGGGITSRQRAVRWVGGQIELCPAEVSSASGLSRDGRQLLFEGGGSAMRWWDDGRIDELGSMPGALAVWPNVAGDDGAVVAGSAIIAPSTGRAWMWTADTGLVNLNDWLPQQGIDLTGWTLVNVVSISADGNTLIGWGSRAYPSGYTRNETFTLGIPSPGAVVSMAVLITARLRRRRA